MIRTPRLLLRAWTDGDLAPFAAINADPRVMALMPAALNRADSDAFASRIRAELEQRGFGLWAVELDDEAAEIGAPFIGFIGLSVPRFRAHFTPCVEVGWRLAAAHWGRGYATEGARAAIAFGFEQAGLDEIVSFTTPDNLASLRVMQKLGMRRDPADDFEHPSLPPGHPLRPHLLYRLSRRRWSPDDGLSAAG